MIYQLRGVASSVAGNVLFVGVVPFTLPVGMVALLQLKSGTMLIFFTVLFSTDTGIRHRTCWSLMFTLVLFIIILCENF